MGASGDVPVWLLTWSRTMPGVRTAQNTNLGARGLKEHEQVTQRLVYTSEESQYNT